MEVDITLEFYQNKATYISPILGSKTEIDIKQVVVTVVSAGPKKICNCIVTSTNGVEYNLNELHLKKSIIHPGV